MPRFATSVRKSFEPAPERLLHARLDRSLSWTELIWQRHHEINRRTGDLAGDDRQMQREFLLDLDRETFSRGEHVEDLLANLAEHSAEKQAVVVFRSHDQAYSCLGSLLRNFLELHGRTQPGNGGE